MIGQHICVLGLGYIGLTTASVLAESGYEVCGVDIDEEVINIINQGKIHIVEPFLLTSVKSAVSSGSLVCSLVPRVSDIYIICVPTPFHENTAIPEPDLRYVMSAVDSISMLLKPGDTVILESTSPVGTTLAIKERLQSKGIETSKLFFAYCPERVIPGKVMSEILDNDRVVGGVDIESTEKVTKFYESFVRGQVLQTDSKTAEMCKLTENSFRDVNIAFANELSILASNLEIDVRKLIDLANHHPRVNILEPGTGVGGHCIAVDPWFIVSKDEDNARIIKTAREVNDSKPEWVVGEVLHEINRLGKEHDGSKLNIVCFGLSFKPDVDDLRESPAVLVVESLLKSSGSNIFVVEPHIQKHDEFELIDQSKVIEKADLVVFLVRHTEFLEWLKVNNVSDLPCLDFCGVTN